MLRINIIIILASIAAFVFGGHGLFRAMKNQNPIEMSCADYIRNLPQGEWLKLKDCYAAIPEAIYSSYQGSTTIEELYVPMYASAEALDAPTPLVLVTEDQGLKATMRKIIEVDNRGNEAEIQKYMEEHFQELLVKRDVEGMVQSGLDLDDSAKSDVARLGENLTPSFFLLEEGKKPSLMQSVGIVALGLIGLVVVAFLFLRGRRSGVVRPSVPTPPAG